MTRFQAFCWLVLPLFFIQIFVGASFFRLVDIDRHIQYLTVTCVTEDAR